MSGLGRGANAMTFGLAAVACGASPGSADADATTAPSSTTSPTSVADDSGPLDATTSGLDTGPLTTADLSSDTGEGGTTGDPPQGSLEIWWIDVEGGAATLFVTPDGTLVLGGLQLDIVSSNARTLAAPVQGGGAPNPACEGADTPGPEFNENPMSVGFVAGFGTFDMLDLGDLTWSYEPDLVCRKNLVGPIDLYQTTHHGQSNCGATQLVHGIDPVVAIMNNGPHKGGAPAVPPRAGTA